MEGVSETVGDGTLAVDGDGSSEVAGPREPPAIRGTPMTPSASAAASRRASRPVASRRPPAASARTRSRTRGATGTGVSAAWPFLDSLVMWGSLLACWLTAQVKLENWLYWIAFDAIGIFLFVSQDLMFVALLFVVYLIVAAIGYVTWLRSRRALAPLG